MLYAGVDAHRTRTHVTVMDDAGKILTRKHVASSPEGLRTVFANRHEPIKAVVEATYNWGPIYDWLAEMVDEVILAHPAKVEPSRTHALRMTPSIPRRSPISCERI